MNEPKRNTLIPAHGSQSIVIRGVEVPQCDNCGDYHPAQPYLAERNSRFYDSRCWVAPQRRELVQGVFNFEANA